ncbi:unnamed protein product [Trichogramma brassicae]|uniref:Uncharacterized protein n=1 Tax=Trichogramma brassicae TaxID=86971 RepID=A0A6H5IRE9_9HYME|nr:unnamed protein product [Trichogramma brassicae]
MRVCTREQRSEFTARLFSLVQRMTLRALAAAPVQRYTRCPFRRATPRRARLTRTSRIERNDDDDDDERVGRSLARTRECKHNTAAKNFKRFAAAATSRRGRVCCSIIIRAARVNDRASGAMTSMGNESRARGTQDVQQRYPPPRPPRMNFFFF